MNDAQDTNINRFGFVNDDIITHDKGPTANTQGLARAAHKGKGPQQKEPIRYRVNEPVGYLNTSAVSGDMKPYIVKIALRARRNDVPHLTRLSQLSEEFGAPSRLHFLC